MAINKDSKARIDRVEVGVADTQNLLVECQIIAPGEYTALYIDDEFSMSDVGLLRVASMEAVFRSRGKVLLVGLGIGLVLGHIMNKPDVEEITVVEYVEDVLEKIGKVYQQVPESGDKINLVCGDIYEWLPEEGQKFDTIWFDIWHVRAFDNLPVMEELHQKFAPYLNEGGWMQSFYRAEMLDVKRHAATLIRSLQEIIADPNIPGTLDLKDA